MPGKNQALAYTEDFDFDPAAEEGNRVSGPVEVYRRHTIIPEWPNAASLAEDLFALIKREIAQLICNVSTLEDIRKVIKNNPALADVGKLLDKTPDLQDSFPVAINLIRLKLRFYLDRGLAKYYSVAGVEPF